MRRSKGLAVLLACGALGSACQAAPAGKGGWTEDFAAAQVRAKEAGRPILADFTGSDWCGWCMKLDREVFSQGEFRKYAAENLVLFMADFPQARQQSAKVARQNAGLQKKYDIQGYPTVLLLDADGKVLGQTGYKPGGPAAYVRHLGELLTQSGWQAPKTAAPAAAASNAPAFKPAPVYNGRQK